jgi:glycine cleavage system T protein (aminomethyltransferase)
MMKRTPLSALHEARGAQWMEYHGWEIPACYSGVGEEYQALQEGAGIIDLSHRGKMRITGRDRRTWLNGQVTQDVKNLPDGRGAYAAVLTPQGRMVSTMRIFALPDALIVDVPAGTAAPMPEYLDRYLIMERAEVEDLTDEWGLVSVQGPHSALVLACVFGDDITRLALWDIREENCGEEPIYVARVTHCGEDGFDIFVPAPKAAALWAALSQCRREVGVHSAGWNALNVRRMEAGIPWWGEELDSSIVPLEARLENAIHFSKGCYVGQEIIARIEARGHVNNLMAGLLIQGDTLPERGAEIRHDGKKVGRIATAVHSLRLNRPIALGFLRRELQEPGTRLEVVTPSAPIPVEVTSLPFVPNDY